MKLIISEGIKENVKTCNFNYLSSLYNYRTYQKARRNYRDTLIESLLNTKSFKIDYESMRLHTKTDMKYFSCTYTGYNIAVAISDKRLGIDIESYKNNLYKNIDVFSSKEEFKIVSNLLKDKSDTEIATFIWCIKESLGKLFQVGLSKGFKTFMLYKENDYKVQTKIKTNESVININYQFYNDYCMVLSNFQ